VRGKASKRMKDDGSSTVPIESQPNQSPYNPTKSRSNQSFQ